MNEKDFPFIAINYASDKDSDYSEKEYKKKEFTLKKYEKFKPKTSENYDKTKTLRAENKVKNLLSNFLRSYESEKRNSDVIIEFNKNQKNKEINNIKYKNKKHLIKKVRTSVNNNNENLLRLNSFNISLNKENKNNILNVASELNYHNINNHSQKRKVGFNLNQSDSTNNNYSKKESSKKKSKKNIKGFKNNYHVKISRTIKNKLRIKDLIKKTASFGSHVLKRNKTGEKVENKTSTIVHINSNSNNDNTNNTNNSIKKTQSVFQNNSYLNFKNDNILLNKNYYNNAISVKASLKKKKGILKNKNINKKEMYNESIHNSILSDLSDYYLNRRSLDVKSGFKEDDSSKKANKNSLIFSSSKKSSLMLNKNLTNLGDVKKNSKDFSIINGEHSSIQKSLSPKRTKKSNIFNKYNVKRAETSIDKKNKKKGRSGQLKRLDTHFRSLKEQLKKSLIFCPEDLDRDVNNDKKKDKNKKKIKPKKMNSLVLKYNNNIKLINKDKTSKSNTNLLKIPPIMNGINTELIIEQNNNSKNETNNNNINTVEHISNLEENKTLTDKNDNLESKKTLKSEKSLIESSIEEYSSYSIKRKNTLYYQKYRILTHKNNIYDSLDDEELEDEEEIQSLYLEPNSKFSIIFDSILFIFTIISLIEIPFYLAINKNFCRNKTITINFSFNFFIDLLNIVDLCLGFFRAYYDLEEQLIKKNKIIALNYLTGWFLFDLIASIPIYTINKFYEPDCIENEIISKYSNIVLDNLHYLLIANRLFKVFKVFLFNQAWKIISNKLNDYGSIILYISLVYAAINYTACFYIFVGRNSFPNWIFHAQLDTESFIKIYICAIYILTMAVTTVGYGDLTCYSMNEIFFQLFILIIGIIGYSYVVSFVSNYIVKINEKSVDFEKKKEILDEIRISHPNLPDELYDRILRYLKFKNYQEKKLINIIFDCLPVGLKNNLISEMYKPIIQNFIFFKNFQNTDFIVRVILAFKPIIAYKNDVLVNEGDIIEDIMFVKRGILSVELPINMVNPQENIEKYLNEPTLTIEKGPNIEKLGNSTIVQGSKSSSKNTFLFNSTIQEQDLNLKNSLNFKSSPSSFFTKKYSRTLYTPITKIEKERKEREEKELERRKHLIYVKILGIRENEHFGDVLMFLEERSPLRVRVKSIKCELFFLKKIDAVKISTNYQNIWKRINKKSVFNFEQMKKSIKNIVEIYCAVKKIKSNNRKKFSNKSEKKGKNINIKRNKSDSNISGLKTIKEEEYLKNSQSQKNIHINYIKLFNNNEIYDDFILENNEANMNSSAVNLERNINFVLPYTNIKFSLGSSNSSLSSIISPKSKTKKKILKNNNNINNVFKESYYDNKMKFGQKVLDAFNRNYKYYRGTEIINKNENKKKNNTIISEETEQEETIENKFNSIIKMSNIPSIGNKIYSSKIANNALSNKIIKKEDSDSDNFYNKIINNELNSDEVINIIKYENLLNKKIDLDFISTKQKDLNNTTHNSLEFKNSKAQILLKLFENENEITQKNKYKNNNENIINENSNENNNSSINNEDEDEIGVKSKNLYSDKNIVYNFDKNSNNSYCNDSSENCATPLNNINENIIKPFLGKKSNVLSINNNISFKIDSSYENFNIISGKILIKNKMLQNKLKNYLLDEIQNISELDININKNKNIFSESEEIKKINSLGDPIFFKDKRNKLMNSPKIDKRKSSPFEFRKNQLIKKKESISYHYSKSIDKKSKKLNNSSLSLNENILPKNKIDKIEKNSKINKFQTGIGIELDNSLLNHKHGKKRRLSQIEILNKNLNKINVINNNNDHVNNSVVDYQKKIKPKRISSIRKKRDNKNLLSQINQNIQKTNQNLNNPEEFYSSYFNSLLEGKMNEKTTNRNSVFFGGENTNTSKISKEKVNKNILYKINQS